MIREYISSAKNPKVRFLVELSRPKGRKEHGLFIAEGLREITIALENGFQPETLFCTSDFLQKKNFRLDNSPCFEIEKSLFSKFAYREDTEGIVAVFKAKERILTEIRLPQNPLVIILEKVEKPGNLGAVLRSADAVNADAVIVCDPVIDLYNPNVIRSSIGCIFSRQVAACNTSDAISWCSENELETFAAVLAKDTELYHKCDFRKPSAFILGTEATGLSKEWIESANRKIMIPMMGSIDSLNVSNAAAVLLFEAARQRNFAKS